MSKFMEATERWVEQVDGEEADYYALTALLATIQQSFGKDADRVWKRARRLSRDPDRHLRECPGCYGCCPIDQEGAA